MSNAGVLATALRNNSGEIQNAAQLRAIPLQQKLSEFLDFQKKELPAQMSILVTNTATGGDPIDVVLFDPTNPVATPGSATIVCNTFVGGYAGLQSFILQHPISGKGYDISVKDEAMFNTLNLSERTITFKNRSTDVSLSDYLDAARRGITSDVKTRTITKAYEASRFYGLKVTLGATEWALFSFNTDYIKGYNNDFKQ